MILKALVVADPVGNVADLITSQCRRLANQRIVATTGDQALALIHEVRPEVVVLSLEMARPTADALVPQFIKHVPDILIIATFRELTVPKMEQLNRLGVDDFVAQPINATEIFRAVSRRFHMPFRQHPRFEVSFEVKRADGAIFGRTINLSAGGMRLDIGPGLAADDSVLVDSALPDGQPKPLRARFRLLVIEGQAPARITARGQFENLRSDDLRRLLSYLERFEAP